MDLKERQPVLSITELSLRPRDSWILFLSNLFLVPVEYVDAYGGVLIVKRIRVCTEARKTKTLDVIPEVPPIFLF